MSRSGVVGLMENTAGSLDQAAVRLEALERSAASITLATERLTDEVGSLRHDLHTLTHVISELHHLAHEGAPEGLPVLVGFLDRIRVDAETAVAASTLIERQLATLNAAVDARGAADE